MMHHEQIVKTLLERFSKDHKFIMVEVGTNSAVSSDTILRNFPNCFLYTIDPYKCFPGEEYEAGREQSYHEFTKKEAIGRLNHYPNRFSLMEMTSDEAFEWLRTRRVPATVVWIDGHHKYEFVKRDIANAQIILGNNCGLIGGHDYNLDGVRKAVKEAFEGKYNIQTGEDSTWWITT